MNEEIEPLPTAESELSTKGVTEEKPEENEANIKELQQTLQGTHLQNRRMSAFAFEPMSLPASRVRIHTSSYHPRGYLVSPIRLLVAFISSFYHKNVAALVPGYLITSVVHMNTGTRGIPLKPEFSPKRSLLTMMLSHLLLYYVDSRYTKEVKLNYHKIGPF